MYLNPEKKKEIFGTYGKSNTDTGSPEAQIALFSYRIAPHQQETPPHREDVTVFCFICSSPQVLQIEQPWHRSGPTYRRQTWQATSGHVPVFLGAHRGDFWRRTCRHSR